MDPRRTVLALDLYLRLDFTHASGQYGQASKQIQELSEVLNALPLHPWRPDAERFRNGNGVYMKLCNFLRLDPEYPGRGLKAGNQLEQVVWDEFAGDRAMLTSVAAGIRSAAEVVRQSERNGLFTEDEFPEGQILTRLHIIRERNRSSVREAVSRFSEKGPLKCQICGFDFRARYGRLGETYIECHDVVPVSKMKIRTKPDLVPVCSNCHRMVHRVRPWLDHPQLRSIIL